MSFKDELYKSYVSTHISHRKGLVDAAHLKRQSRVFQQYFGSYLPINKNAKIADLGCGSGGLVWWLRELGYQNTQGVDASAEQVKQAHVLGINSVMEGDVFDFLGNNKDFDVLLARDLIEHFEKQAVYDFLVQTHSCLAPNGTLILQVPNADSPYFGRVRYGDFTHELAFTTSSITQLLGAAGFTHIEVHPWRPAVTGVRSLIRHIAWRVIEPVLKLPIWIESGGWHRIVTMNLIAVAKKRD